MLFRMALANLDQQRTRLANTQEQASSGLRINRPSDDPLGAGTATRLRTGRSALQQLEENVSNARARVGAADSAIANSTNALIRAKELAVSGGNGSQDAISRLQIAEEVKALHAVLVAEANTRFGGGFIFAGYASDAAPFEEIGAFADAPPATPNVNFVGDSSEIEVQIEEGARVQVGLDGRRVFLGDADANGTADAGREDLFDVLADLHTALVTDDAAGSSAALTRIDAGLEQLSIERTRMGAVATRLDSASERLAKREVELETRLSEVQDADLAEVVSRLVQEESALQAGLAAMGRLLPPTLMDFLR
jgi:flagellar hook-associated protein 3 FlgL